MATGLWIAILLSLVASVISSTPITSRITSDLPSLDLGTKAQAKAGHSWSLTSRNGSFTISEGVQVPGQVHLVREREREKERKREP